VRRVGVSRNADSVGGDRGKALLASRNPESCEVSGESVNKVFERQAVRSIIMTDGKKLPSVYIYGMPINRLDGSVYGGLFGNATRAVGLAINLAKRGHRVALEVEDDFDDQLPASLRPPGLILSTPRSRDMMLADADILAISCTNIQSFEELSGRCPYLAHPVKVFFCCFDNGQRLDLSRLGKVRFITFNNSIQKSLWDRRCTGIPAITSPYGVNEFLTVDAAIQADCGEFNAVWMGAFRRPDMLERVVRFAFVNPECNVNVVTRHIFDQRLPADEYGGIRRPYADFRLRDQPARFYEVVEEICGMPAPANLRYLGTLEGDNEVVLGRHQIGLDFSRFPGQLHDNTKIMDYLRSGLYVICDRGTPSYRFVTETGFGSVVDAQFSDAQIRKAFLAARALVTIDRRRMTARYMRWIYGWHTRARFASSLLTAAHCDHGHFPAMGVAGYLAASPGSTRIAAQCLLRSLRERFACRHRHGNTATKLLAVEQGAEFIAGEQPPTIT
jgi:hypothetical protein